MFKTYITLGKGKMAVGLCHFKNDDKYALTFEELKDCANIGDDVSRNNDEFITGRVYITIPCLESLAVVEGMLERIKEKLKENK